MKKGLLSFLIVLAMVLQLMAFPVSAEIISGEYGSNTLWSYDTETCVLTLEGTGSVNGGTKIPWLDFQYEIKEVIIGEGYTSIAPTCFRYYSELETVHLPSSIYFVGKDAFTETSLNTVYFNGTSDEWEIKKNKFQDKTLAYCENVICTDSPTDPDEAIVLEYFYDIENIYVDQYIGGTLPENVRAVDENGNEVLCNISYTKPDIKVAGEHRIIAKVTLPRGYIMPNDDILEVQFSVFVNEAPHGKCGEDLTWELVIDELIIRGTGDMYEYDNTVPGKEIPWKDHASKIAAMSLYAQMTSLSNDFFAGTNVVYVSLPSTVQTIADGAFRDNTSLHAVYTSGDYFKANGSVLYSADMTRLISLTYKGIVHPTFKVPNSVTEIAPYAFDNSPVEKLYIPVNVNKIGTNAIDSLTTIIGRVGSYAHQFALSSGNAFLKPTITSVEFPDDITVKVGESISLPDKLHAVTNIYLSTDLDVTYSNFDTSYAHSGYITATVIVPDEFEIESYYKTGSFRVTVENHVYTGECGDNLTWRLEAGELVISGSGAMDENCAWSEYIDTITSVELPRGITHISDGAFKDSQITELILPDTVTSIGSGIIENTDVTEIIIPDSVTEIKDGAFKGAPIENITCDSSEYNLIGGVLMNADSTRLVYYPPLLAAQSFTVSENVTAIADFAFDSATNLTSIEIPATVTEIGEDSFRNVNASFVVVEDSYAESYVKEKGFVYETVNAELIEEGSSSTINYKVYANGKMVVSGSGLIRKYSSLHADNSDMVKTIIIDEGITGIDDDYFTMFPNVESISLPASTVKFTGLFTYDIPSLKRITISENHTTYKSKDGILYNGNTLVLYPSSREGSVFTTPEGVTEIAQGAFWSCKNLNEIVISKDLKYINFKAFSNCISLKKITVDKENQRYSDESGILFNKNKTTLTLCPSKNEITSYTLPETVTYVEDYAFYNCDTLKSFTFNNNIQILGNNIFEDCGSLESVILPADYYAIPSNCFKNCTSLKTVKLPETLTDVGYYSFYGCSALSSINLPDCVTYISESAFEGCSSLENFKYPKSLTNIGQKAFQGCVKFTDAILPEGLSTLSAYAFYDCSAITTAYVPSTVKTLGKYAFGECINLTSVTLGNGLKKIDSGAFYSCEKLTSVTIPNTVTDIGTYAFSYCNALESINIPKGVTRLRDYVFRNCKKLISIEIPDTVQAIDKYAFQNCLNITEITIPQSVTSIVASAFYGCNFEKVNFLANVTEIGTEMFSSMPLKEITLSDSIKKINAYAFSYTDITSITLPSKLETLGNEVFSQTKLNKLTIPGTVLNFNAYSVYNCRTLSELTLSEGVTSITSYFYRCDSLKKITIPESVTSISDNAFSKCSDIVIYGEKDSYAHTYATAHNIPFVYPKIKIAALDEWTDLCGGEFYVGQEISLPEYAYAAIEGSSTPVAIKIVYDSLPDTSYAHVQTVIATLDLPSDYELPEGVELTKTLTYTISILNVSGKTDDISWSIFGKTLTVSGSGNIPDFILDTKSGNSNSPWAEYHEWVDTIIVESGITGIGSYAFYQFRNAANITLPEGVTRIGEAAFAHCSSDVKYIEFNIPSTVTVIESAAFENMNISSITLPEGITVINSDMFYKCPNLYSVTIKGKLTYIASSAFYGAPVMDVYFSGTNAEWALVTIEEKGNEDFLLDAIIHCTDDSSLPLESTKTSYKKNPEKGTIDLTITVPKSAFTSKSAQLVVYGMNGSTLNAFTKMEIYQAGDYMLSISDKGISTIKILVWESFSTMKPCTCAETIQLTGGAAGGKIESTVSSYRQPEDTVFTTFYVNIPESVLNVKGAQLIIMGYNGDTCTSVAKKDVEKANEQLSIDLNGATEAKIIVWESFTSMRPLTLAEIQKINKK